MLLLVATFCLSACTTTITGYGLGAPNLPSQSVSPSNTSASTVTPAVTDPATLTWSTVTDVETGVRFDLPGVAAERTKPELAKDGTPLTERIYEVDLQTFAVSGGIVAGAAPIRFDLDAYAAGIVTAFKSQGAADAVILDKKALTVSSHPALDFRVSFTARNPAKDKAVWLIRAIDDSGTLLLLQTVGFAADPATLLPLAHILQARLVNSAVLP